MANVIKPKRSSTSSSAPTTSDLADGEIAVNTADQKIYMRAGSNIVTVADVSSSSGLSNVVEDTSPQLGGNLDVNSKNINFGDSASSSDDRLNFGADADLEIYHDGTSSYIHHTKEVTYGFPPPTPTKLILKSQLTEIHDANGDVALSATESSIGGLKLYHAGSVRLETKNQLGSRDIDLDISGNTNLDGILYANGVRLDDSQYLYLGTNNDLRLYHDGSNSYITDAGTGSLKIGGSVELVDGVDVTGDITVSGTVDGRDVATDGTKLDTIATNADVTPSWVPSSDPSYITGLTFNNLTGKNAGTGDYSTNGDLVSGRGSGGVALTINDGYGNANVTFNHQNGTPEQNGQSARIEVNTDATSNEATMYFEFSASDVTANTAVGLTTGMTLAHDYVEIPNRIRHAGDNDTYVHFDTDRIRLFAGGTAKIDTDIDYLRSDESDTMTGGLTIDSGTATGLTIDHDDFGAALKIIRNHASNAPSITWENTSGRIGILYANDSDNELKWRPGTGSTDYGIWHSGNDGSGSGLDADLLDGAQGSLYARLASPTFTGTPAAPTASAGTNTTQLATTAFVTTAVSGAAGGISNVVEDTTPQLGGDLDMNNSGITGTGEINITGQVKSTGNHVATSGLANFTAGSSGYRQYAAAAGSGGGNFLLGKIQHNSSSDGGVSGVVHFAYDYGTTTDNANIHFTFAQRSGSVRGHWWYENTDDDAGSDNVKLQVINDGSGGVYVWVILGDFATCSVECWWRSTNMVGKNSGAGIAGSLSSETVTSGTTALDTSNDPTAEMHIGKLYSHSTIHGTLNSDVVATTQSTNDNSTKVATTAYVKQEIDALKDLLYAYEQ